jgi:hypothetical protein
VDAELTSLVAGGRDHAAPLGIPSDDDRLATQPRVVTGVDRGVEAVHVAVEDAATGSAHAIILRSLYANCNGHTFLHLWCRIALTARVSRSAIGTLLV